MRKTINYLLSILLVLCLPACTHLFAQEKSTVAPGSIELQMLEDKTGTLDLSQATHGNFAPKSLQSLNLGLTHSTFWFRVIVHQQKPRKGNVFLKIHNGTLTNAVVYKISGDKIDSQSAGTSVSCKEKLYRSQYPVFRLTNMTDTTGEIYLKISGNGVLDLPMMVDSGFNIVEAISMDQLFFGIYFGIILVMFFYNIFIYVTVRDRNYLYYVLYILSVGFLQSCLKGYAYRYLWPSNFWLTEQAPDIAIALSGVFSIAFVINFLNVKIHLPKVYYLLCGLTVLYIVCIGINLSGSLMLAQQLLQGLASIVAIVIMGTGIVVYRRGFKPALYFNISWFFFLSSVIVYVLKDAGVLPYNNFTGNSILLGSGVEVSLLSFALADKINTYRKEREEMQLQAQAALQENVRIVNEQNVMLDQKVNERTLELKAANEDLQKAMTDLKEAESQLVEQEKMASLGQLTAGIAHEINNPINFVTSNVKPLNRDINILLGAMDQLELLALGDEGQQKKKEVIDALKRDIDYDYLKMEIDQLLKGITEGATRTAEIVKGLRIFSRLDEDDLKRANLNEGLESTLIIINNLLNNTIVIEKKYSNLPLIECYPGKLNQVFLNIVSNAIYAIRKKFGENNGGIITIKSYFDEQNVYISLADNGIGMDEQTRKRLFEPFFTTKDVGEGTGLGLSIAYNTINKHSGTITATSTKDVGTEFIIRLPLTQN